MTESYIRTSLDTAKEDIETGLAVQFTSGDKFAKFYLTGAAHLVDLLADKRIEPRDLAVAVAMLTELQVRSGRTGVRASRVSEMLRVSKNHIQASIKRLRQAQLIVKVIDPRTHIEMYLLSPYILSGGSEKQRGFQIKNYQTAILSDDPRFSKEELDNLFDEY